MHCVAIAQRSAQTSNALFVEYFLAVLLYYSVLIGHMPQVHPKGPSF